MRKLRPLIFALTSMVALQTIAFQASAAGANKEAPKGGNFVYNLESEPPTIHPITSTDVSAQRINYFVCEGLATRDLETYEWQPALAEKWEVSKDNKTFTFKIRKDALFQDGKPVTAEDVKFSFDAIFNPVYQAMHLMPYFEGIEKVEVIDPLTVKFTAKNTYFGNFDTAATMSIIPKHVYGDPEKSKKMNRTSVCSGPYMISKFDRGQSMVLKKFDKWYGNNVEYYKGKYNFDTITFRFYKDENVIIERAKKGELDHFELRVEAFMKKAVGEPWGKTIIKHKVENSYPKSYGFVGWNFRRELFQDKNVRLALAHLMNRDEMNKKFRYGMSDPATSPIYNQSDYSPKNKALKFDPKLAQTLLSKAGWKDTNKDGVLDKTVGGKLTDFRFTLIHANKDAEKYWTLYKEDLKKAGIELEIKYLEWNSFLKLVDEGNFDAVAMAWGGGSVDPNPKQIWHSSSAVPGGSNFIAYKNPEVDKMIDEAILENDKPKRINLLKKVYQKIADDAPYAFLFNDKFIFYAVSNRVGQPSETLKFDLGREYWWMKKP